MRFTIHPKTLIISIIIAVFLALLLEGVLFLGLRNPDMIPGFLVRPYQYYYLSQDRSIFQVTDCAEYDPQVFYRSKKGNCDFQNREFHVTHYTNRAGLRDDEQSLASAPIVILGDSYTMGWGVEQQKSYPQILERLLNQKVLNAGISSFGTAREMILLDKIQMKNIGTLVIQYHPNDFKENQVYEANNFVLPVRPARSYDSLKKFIADRQRYFPFKHITGLSKSFVHSMFNRNNKKELTDIAEARTFLNILRNSGVDNLASNIVVFEIERLDQNNDNFVNAVDYWLTNEEYKNLKITTLRTKGIFSMEDYFILDDHINESGHQKLANHLWPYLQNPADARLVSSGQ